MIDLHNDFLTALNDPCSYLENINYNVKICSAVFTSELKNSLKFLKKSKKILKNYDFCKLCIEDMSFFNFGLLDELIKIKPFYVSLTWNNDNQFTGGAYGSGEMTNEGKKLVHILEQNNILIDCAHLNYKSFAQLVEVAQKPFICSHTGFCDVVSDKRNLAYSQIKDIISCDGIVGLFFVGKYITKKLVKIFDIVKNIDYFVQNFGYEHLAIGSDFYGTKDLPIGINNYQDMEKVRQQMFLLGYDNKAVEAIFEKNAQKFWLKNFS